MSFIHFGFLAAGAAAMTLPIWIHLLLRQRVRPMEIGSIRFIEQVVRRTKRRQRIRRWLLLALRCLAVLMLGMLFARPFLPDIPVDGRTREAAVLIDRSASMSAQHEDQTTAFETAKRRALKYIDSLGDEARVHIGLFDSTGVEPISVQALADAKEAATGTDFEEAFAWAADLLDSSDRKDRSLLVFSDLQRRGLPAGGGLAFPADIPVDIEDPSPAIAQNLAIESVQPSQVELRPKIPVALSVRVVNGGPFPIADCRLSIDLEGPSGTISEERTLALDANERKSIQIPLPAVTEPGIYRGTASLDREDALIWDNRRFVGFEVRYPDRVLLVDGEPGRNAYESETYFLETALRLQSPVGQGPARTFEVERLVWDRGSGFPDLAGYRLIVLANLGRFTATDARRLNEFVDAGGNVLIFAGERTSPAVLDPMQQQNLLAQMTIGPARDAIARVTEFDERHPAMAPFADPQHGDLRGLRVRRLLPIEKWSSNTQVLMRSGKWPLIVSHNVGQGKVVLVVTSADREWNDWPQNRLFVPLVRQLAAWLTGQLDSRQPVKSVLIDDATTIPGIETAPDAMVVSNIEPGESDIRRLGVEQFRETLGLPAADPDAENEVAQSLAPAAISRSDEKWPLVVWALLGLLALETVVASRVHE